MTYEIRLKEIVDGWMKDYFNVYWGNLERKSKEFIMETIGAMSNKSELTDEAAVEQLKKSGWLERHDAEVERRVSVNELINTLMARGDKSISISIVPWRWED